MQKNFINKEISDLKARYQEEKDRKTKKTMKLITIIIVMLLVISIILFITIYYLEGQLFKFYIDDKKVSSKNDLFVYESTPNELISHLSFKQDAIFYAAKSTYFEEFYFKPEYRVLFDTELIDKFIKEQKSSLKEISSYVENGGRLIYLVETIDTKETSKVISAFLSENNDFILEKEEFIIPNEENSSFGYYAILKRENHA